MADTNRQPSQCILSDKTLSYQHQDSFLTSPLALCGGSPPAEAVLLYSLCLNCELLHQRGERSIFSRISSELAKVHEDSAKKQNIYDTGFYSIIKMLERLSIGDPDARVLLPDDIDAFRTLESQLNRMADFMKDLVDDSHETAMGLCEHYETLIQLAAGDLEKRSSINSPIELIAKLGELINSQAETFLDALRQQKRAEEAQELIREQLHHSQKLESVGELAGGIAHEFNNILAAIIGYAGILEMKLGTDSPNLPSVHQIIKASEKAASLTRGMLSFSRKQVMAMEPVHLNSFMLGMKEMLNRLSGENIEFDLQLDPHDPAVCADLGQLQQIVLNLYNNARDAMPKGGCLTIATGLRQVAGNETDVPSGITPGSYVLLSVRDTGCGIAPEDFDRIFDPFFTTKEVGRGTGLGLSIIFGIVQQHNGFIRVVTAEGKGSTFSIWLPEYSQPDLNNSAGVFTKSKHEVPGNETILIGEDNEDVRPMIVELLQDFGYQVLEACDGNEVVMLMENFGDTVDLLLLDVIMPRMNGYEALSAVRELYPFVPCVFLSGYSDEILQKKAKIPGQFEYLSKPILPEKLLTAVRKALDYRRDM